MTILSRRKRKLRRVTRWLLAGVVAALVAGFVVYRLTRSEVRRPGEDLDDITQALSADLPPEAPAPAFTDVTAPAGLAAFRTFAGERTSQLPEDMGSGLAWGDYDGDGDDDLFAVSAGGSLAVETDQLAESMLFENLGDGAFARSTAFPETRIRGMGAAWGDYDGDGWLDLALTGYDTLQLFANRPAEAGGRTLVADGAIPNRPGFWAGVSWADVDNDGDLDLYVCGYVQFREDPAAAGRVSSQAGRSVPHTLNPASYEPEPNLLFLNEGGLNEGGARFAEVALPYGLSNPGGRSLSALWHDFDQDGLLDVYVANDISDNAMLLNRGETFEDVSLAAWVADYRGAMGLAAGDWNRDGDDDLFVTHWVAQENALYDSRLADTRDSGNPQFNFSDLAAPLGLGQVALQAVGWGTEFADFDSDGWLDLVVANGSTLETGDEPKRLKKQAPMLFWNQRGEYYHDLAPVSELLATERLGRGLAVSDYDLDGDLDVAMIDLDAGLLLLRNDMQQGRWVEISLDAGRGRSAKGSTVTVTAGGVAFRRTAGSSSYLSQSSRLLHFGLGSTEAIEAVEVEWLGGGKESFLGVELGGRWRLVRGSGRAESLGAVARASAPIPADERERTLKFWETQRAAMDAMKRDGDVERALGLFARALELDPAHGDSRYYLANLLWTTGDRDGALRELDELRRRNPMSHRAAKQWGVLKALAAESPADLEAASRALERAVEINSEETGGLLALGEVSLLRGRIDEARKQLEWACHSNPRAVGGFYLRAFLAHQRGAGAEAAELLRTAQAARGPEWKPEGTVAEGDVKQRMHIESSPLSRFWQAWDGGDDPTRAFGELEAFLKSSAS